MPRHPFIVKTGDDAAGTVFNVVRDETGLRVSWSPREL